MPEDCQCEAAQALRRVRLQLDEAVRLRQGLEESLAEALRSLDAEREAHARTRALLRRPNNGGGCGDAPAHPEAECPGVPAGQQPAAVRSSAGAGTGAGAGRCAAPNNATGTAVPRAGPGDAVDTPAALARARACDAVHGAAGPAGPAPGACRATGTEPEAAELGAPGAPNADAPPRRRRAAMDKGEGQDSAGPEAGARGRGAPPAPSPAVRPPCALTAAAAVAAAAFAGVARGGPGPRPVPAVPAPPPPDSLCRLLKGGGAEGYYYAAASGISEGAVVMQAAFEVSAPLALTKTTIATVTRAVERALLPHLLRLAHATGEAPGVLLLLLRCLLLKASEPGAFGGLLALEANLDRQPPESLGRWHSVAQRLGQAVSEMAAEGRLPRESGGLADWDEAECVRLLAVAATNAFGTCGERAAGAATELGLCAAAARFQHSCAPGVFVDHGAAPLVFRAMRPFRAGDPLEISYTDAFLPRWRRRRRLWASKRFWCRCPRCRCPSDQDQAAGALRCQACARGFLQDPALPESEAPGRAGGESGAASGTACDPSGRTAPDREGALWPAPGARWTCSGCGNAVPHSEVEAQDAAWNARLAAGDQLLAAGASGKARAHLLQLIAECEGACHRDHYIPFQARTALVVQCWADLDADAPPDLLLQKLEHALHGAVTAAALLPPYDPVHGSFSFEAARACEALARACAKDLRRHVGPALLRIKRLADALGAEARPALETVQWLCRADVGGMVQARDGPGLGPLALTVLYRLGAQACQRACAQFRFCCGAGSASAAAAEAFLVLCKQQLKRVTAPG